MYVIYKISNIINEKIYVGLTKNLKRRWYEHKKNSKKITKNTYAINFAMHKYGTENFSYSIIDTALDLNEANLKEIKWIQDLKKQGFQLYNETNGGDGTKGHSHPWTEEQKKKMSERNSGAGNPMYGVQKFGKDNPNYGKEMKPHVKQTLLDIRRKLTDEQINQIITLYQTNNYTQTQLSKDFNLSLTQIHRIVNGKSWGNKSHDEILTKPNLTEESVKELKSLYATGNYTQKELSLKFNISLSHTNRILRGKKWKNTN